MIFKDHKNNALLEELKEYVKICSQNLQENVPTSLTFENETDKITFKIEKKVE